MNQGTSSIIFSMRVKLDELKKRIEAELSSAQKSAGENKKSAILIAGGMASGYSIAGDLEHARNTAQLSEVRLGKLVKLKEELDKAGAEAPISAEPVCFISIEYDSGEKKGFYFVNNAVYLSGFNLISPDSPLGKSLMGKSIGSEFSYTSGETLFSGKVTEIL